MPRDILQNSLETMSAMISAAGTKRQVELLNSLKENTEVLLAAEENSNIEEFTDTMQKVISILEDPEFDLEYLEFIKNDIRAIKLSLSEMTTKMLKVSISKTRQILEENKVEEEVEETEDKPEEIKPEDIKVESKEEAKETGAADEAVNKENNDKENKIKEEEENTMEKTVEELKEKLKKAKEAASKCDSSTLAKVGKVSLGLAIVAGAAYGGYYYANNYGGRNTTIIINGGDED